ncbi:hypothetical protein DL765_010822 [Monosporascus sp. GIB2]|nr:hypothetical protein DL765_010822 [Monosporascus sp. GIB2]
MSTPVMDPSVSTPKRSSLPDASPNTATRKSRPQFPEPPQSTKERVFQLVFDGIEEEWQVLIDKRAQHIGRPPLRVQFKPVANDRRRIIHDQILGQSDLSLQGTADLIEEALFDLWKTHAKKLNREFKDTMGVDIVQQARTKAQRVKASALQEVEKSNAVPSTPNYGQRSKAIPQKSPDQPSPDQPPRDLGSNILSLSTTEKLEPQPKSCSLPSTPRYGLRSQSVMKAQAKSRQQTQGSAKPILLEDANADAPGSPTPRLKLGSVQRPGARQARNQRRKNATVPVVGMRQLSIEENSASLELLSACLLDALNQHLGAVTEMMNKELEKEGRPIDATREPLSESVKRNVLRLTTTRPLKDFHLKVSSICADVMLDWMSDHRDAIEQLKHVGLSLVHEALLAVEHAKTDFHSQVGPAQHQAQIRGGPRKAQLKSSSVNDVGDPDSSRVSEGNFSGLANSMTGEAVLPHPEPVQSARLTGLREASMPHTYGPASQDTLLLLAQMSTQKSPSPPGKSLRKSARLARGGAPEPPQLSADDPFLKGPSSSTTPQAKKLDEEAGRNDFNTLRKNVSATRDSILKKINLQYGGMANAQPMPERPPTLLAAYQAIVRRLTEQLKELDGIREKEGSIRCGFAELQKVLFYINFGEDATESPQEATPANE